MVNHEQEPLKQTYTERLIDRAKKDVASFSPGQDTDDRPSSYKDFLTKPGDRLDEVARDNKREELRNMMTKPPGFFKD